jgi:hypothetical protein
MQRRLGLALVLFFFVSGANAQWQKKYPVVKYGVIPVETQTGTTKTMDGFLHQPISSHCAGTRRLDTQLTSCWRRANQALDSRPTQQPLQIQPKRMKAPPTAMAIAA